MLDERLGLNGAPPKDPDATLRRVVFVCIGLLLAPVAFAYLAILVTGGEGFSVNGFGAFLGISMLWCIGGAVLIRIGRVRSIWLGLLFMLSPSLGSFLSRESVLGGLIALAIGALAGFFGSRGVHMLRVPRNGYAVMLGLALVATVPMVATSGNTPEQAVAAMFHDDVLAVYEPAGGRELFMLVPSNRYTGKNGRDVRLVHVERDGRHWRVTPARGNLDPTCDGRSAPTSLHADFFGFSDDALALNLPEDCARPFVFVVPVLDLEGNCWLPTLGIVAGVAPGRARSLELTMRDGSTVVRTLRSERGFGPGFIVPYLGADGRELSPAAQPVRFAFRDDRGTLLDARPSMRFAYPWYQGVASLFPVEVCRSGDPGAYSCATKKEIQPRDRIYRALVSLSLLRPDEYRSICGTEPPAGDWVALARVDLDTQHLFIDYDVGRDFAGRTVRQVSFGVRVIGSASHGWPDLAPVHVKTHKPCFPGPRSAPDLYGSD